METRFKGSPSENKAIKSETKTNTDDNSSVPEAGSNGGSKDSGQTKKADKPVELNKSANDEQKTEWINVIFGGPGCSQVQFKIKKVSLSNYLLAIT